MNEGYEITTPCIEVILGKHWLIKMIMYVTHRYPLLSSIEVHGVKL